MKIKMLPLVLLLAEMVLVPGVRASIAASANPSSGNIDYFPAIPEYDDFSSNLTVTGSISGTPTWTAAPATGSPVCATHIAVTFGNPNAWNTTAKFDDHATAPCQATITLTISSPSAGSAQTSVAVSYFYCRNCL